MESRIAGALVRCCTDAAAAALAVRHALGVGAAVAHRLLDGIAFAANWYTLEFYFFLRRFH